MKTRETQPANTAARGGTVSLPVLPSNVVRPSRSGPRRAVVLGIIQLLMVVHLVQWLIMGRTISPVEPSESMELVKRGVLNAGAVFFIVALLATFIFGRWFCGWGCHIVMMQDGCSWLLRRIGLRPKPFRSRLLIYVPFVLAVYMFIWPAVYRWGVAPLSQQLHARWELIPAFGSLPPWPGFSAELTTTHFWETFPGVLVAIPFLLICGFATVYFLGNKGFCTYGCPYGGFFAPLDQFALGRIRVSDACEQCGHCTAVCTSNVRVHEEVHAYGMVVDPGCMKCLDCVSVCPNDALSFRFGGPVARHPKPERAAPPPNLDLTWRDELGVGLAFLVSFFAWRGVYESVPMLMAGGLGICTAFLAWKTWRMLCDKSVNFHRFRLKYKGAITRSGVVFLTLVGLWIVWTLHSGLVNTFATLADRADRHVTMPRMAIFAASPMAMPPAMTEHAERALRYYQRSAALGDGGIGLKSYPGHRLRQAWLLACQHDFAGAETLMREFVARHGAEDLVCRDIMLLMRLQLQDAEAAAYAREVLDEHGDFVRLRDEAVAWLESEGRTDDAVALLQNGIDVTGGETKLYLMRRLSLLLLESGRVDEGIALVEQTIAIDDANPAAYVVLARALLAVGRPNDASAAIDAATALNPESLDQRAEIATVLEALGRDLEAEAFRRPLP